RMETPEIKVHGGPGRCQSSGRCQPGKESPGQHKKSPGQQWAKLLVTKNGPLEAILGNYATAPLDGKDVKDEEKLGPGNKIGLRMGKAIAEELRGQWELYVPRWLQINRELGFRMAAGMDRLGYWHLSPKDGSIKGPFAIP